MGEVDRPSDRNEAVQSDSLAAIVCQESVNHIKEPLVDGNTEQENRRLPPARLIALKPDAIIPVHLDKNGIAKEDIKEQWPCALNRAYFIKKNLRLYNLAIESGGGICSVLEFQVFSTSPAPNFPENMFVEVFRGIEDCVLLRVTETYDCSNSDSGTWTITCEDVSMEVSQKVLQIYG